MTVSIVRTHHKTQLGPFTGTCILTHLATGCCVGSVSQVQQDEEWDDWVRQAFKSLDTNQDGVICEDDMRLTMNEEPEEVLTILRLLQSF